MSALLPGIREADPADVPTIADVCARATRQAYNGLVTDDYIDRVIAHWYGHERLHREIFPTPLWFGFDVATVGDIVVGVAGSGWGDDEGAELFTLYVDPAWHRRGIGRALVEHESRRVRRVGAARLDVAVMPGNAPAVLFYERCGFAYTCERPIHAPHGREGGPDHAVVYSLAL
ncbi:MAG TPA: N-acetyltransferase [Luteitalea sp.]|nr:N-acetyltransferase [Luteitalea sp.]